MGLVRLVPRRASLDRLGRPDDGSKQFAVADFSDGIDDAAFQT